jgi:hypothetical protein
VSRVKKRGDNSAGSSGIAKGTVVMANLGNLFAGLPSAALPDEILAELLTAPKCANRTHHLHWASASAGRLV